MNISLTPEIDSWVAAKVKSGMYKSSSEVVRASLRLLREREEQRQAMVEDLRHELLTGVHQLDAGKSTNFDAEHVSSLKESARQKLGV